MGDTTATPDVELDEAAAATPEEPPEATTPPEQGEPAAPDAPADTSAAEPDRLVAQAEFTRSQQAFSALKAELGLEKKATREEVIAAVQALRQAPPADDEDADEGEELDPRITEAEQRAFNAELRVQAAIYGDEFTKDAVALIDVARTTNDPEELITAFAAFRDRHATKAAGAELEADEEPGTTDQPLDVGLSEGDRGPSARQTSTSAGRRGESGVVGAVRGIFQAAGITTGPPKP